MQAVEVLGFETKLLGSGSASSLRLELGGMTCSSCSTAIEARLQATPGVAGASVSLITSTAEVSVPSHPVSCLHFTVTMNIFVLHHAQKLALCFHDPALLMTVAVMWPMHAG